MEMVELKKGIKDGQEFEHFAHGGHEIEGELIQLSSRKVFIDKYNMCLLVSIRKLPVMDILRMVQISNSDLYVELEKYRVFLNAKFHKLLCMNIFSAETGDRVDKTDLFEALEFKYTYETYLRNSKVGKLTIDEVKLIVSKLSDKSQFLHIATNGETWDLGMFWEGLLNE